MRGKFAWGVREFGLGIEKFAVYIIKTRKKSVKKISIKNIFILTLSVPIPDIEKKSTQVFIFTFLCGASKGFMKAFKAFIKPFEAPQRSAKIKNLC